jgi:dTDP-4-amino-4,6-dideoxygalactose transaminase
MQIRSDFLPFALPDIDESELMEIKEVLDSGWITTGRKTHQFEQQFANYVGASHAIAVNSCTAAMHLALEAIGLQRGDEVVTSPYSFAATAEVIRYFDARPVFVDVDADCLNMNPVLLAKAITKRTKAILPVHVAGLPAKLDAIYAIAADHHLAVIEDAAHAFPAKYNERFIGQDLDSSLMFDFPRSVCFSFYATKTITTAEGGMLCTDSNTLAERCSVMALHGISKDAWKRYTAEGSWYYEIVAPGYKYNMTDVAAAMGLAQLRKAGKMWQRRETIARQYTQAFSGCGALQVPAVRPGTQHAWHLYMLRLNLEQLRIDRSQFVEELKRRSIGASVHFIPLHLHPYYRQTYGYQSEDFPVAYREYQREVSLPIYSKMNDADVQDVIEAVLDIVDLNRL